MCLSKTWICQTSSIHSKGLQCTQYRYAQEFDQRTTYGDIHYDMHKWIPSTIKYTRLHVILDKNTCRKKKVLQELLYCMDPKLLRNWSRKKMQKAYERYDNLYFKKACIQQTFSWSCSGLPTILAWNKKLQALNLDRLWLYFKLFSYLIRSLVNSGREANFKDRAFREFCAEISLIHPMGKILQNG